MKAHWLLHQRRKTPIVSQDELATALTRKLAAEVNTETIRNIENLAIGIDEETDTLLKTTLDELKAEKLNERQEVTA